jgi:hypothetical protein
MPDQDHDERMRKQQREGDPERGLPLGEDSAPSEHDEKRRKERLADIEHEPEPSAENVIPRKDGPGTF